MIFDKEYIQNGGNPCKIRISAVFIYPFVAYLSLKSALCYYTKADDKGFNLISSLYLVKAVLVLFYTSLEALGSLSTSFLQTLAVPYKGYSQCNNP